MAAPESADEESRVVFDYGPERMVLRVSETFSRSDPNFEEVVRRKIGPSSNSVEALDLHAALRAVAYWPKTNSWTAEANPLMGVYVMRSDGTVQQLEFYLNPAASQELEAWQALAAKVANTGVEKQKSLPSEGGERRFGGFVVLVPEGYVLTTQRGPDFAVYHLRKLTKFGEPAASLNVYRGNHPQGPQSGPAKTSSAVLLGVPAQWSETVRTENMEAVISTEALVRLPQRATPQVRCSDCGIRVPPMIASYADIFLRAGTPEQMNELKRIAGLMTVAGTASATSSSPMKPSAPEPIPQIRVRNNSTTDFRTVTVGGKEYGDIKAGATTGYKAWIDTYGYQPVFLMTSSGAMQIPAPIDHVGDPKVGDGHFTYILTIRDGQLVSDLERDKE
jgi:hypothetical protein